MTFYYVQGLAWGAAPSNAIPTNIVTLYISYAPASAKVYTMTTFPLSRYQQLQSLSLISALSGALSTDLSMMQRLNTIDLSYNSLNGSIDSVSWGNMSSLTSVTLSFNKFTSLGSAFSNTPGLQQLYIARNPALNGTIPQSLLQSTQFTRL